jgi:primosomal protein N' (replication factor Y)
MTYAEVILPLPLYSTFTYSIPDNLQSAVGVGFRVLVPFGRKKFYTGIVTMLHNQRPGNYEVKDIVAVLDNDSILRHPQMKFWQWISDYYLCPVGEVYKAAVPAGMKVESETRVSANPDFIDTDGSMTERETVVYDMLLAKERLAHGARNCRSPGNRRSVHLSGLHESAPTTPRRHLRPFYSPDPFVRQFA